MPSIRAADRIRDALADFYRATILVGFKRWMTDTVSSR